MNIATKYFFITVFLTLLQVESFASKILASATITPVFSIVDATCSSLTGSVTITSVTNGTPNYTITEGVTTLTTGITVPFTITNVSIGTHTYVVDDASGSTATFTALVTQSGSTPNLSAISPVTLNCTPSTATLNASSTSTNIVSYLWSGSGIISGAFTQTPTVNQPGNYTVTLSEGFCTNTVVVSVLSNSNSPNISITSPIVTPCVTSSIIVTGTSSTAGATFSWSPQSVSTNTALVNSSGNYTLTVTEPLSSCVSTSVVSVAISPNVVAGIIAGADLNCSGIIGFSCLNTSFNNQWIISTGDTVFNSTQFSFAFPNVGTYSVTLITSPNSNCADTAETTITINAVSTIVYESTPNVFTPNGDGVNDLIDFSKFIACDTYEFEIFDRWGLSMLKSTNTKQTYWDGRTASGIEVSAGTYFFYLKTSSLTFKGTISLFR